LEGPCSEQVAMCMILTVVAPSFNQADYIEDTISSVLGQTNVDLEYIVIKGGGQDALVVFIRKYDYKLVIPRQK